MDKKEKAVRAPSTFEAYSTIVVMILVIGIGASVLMQT